MKRIYRIILPLAAVVAMGSCSDYDNGFTEQELRYYNDFKKMYGDIDAQQDWNIAERGSVTVTVDGTSEVKVYALMGNEYAIVADYTNVVGQQTLAFDVPEGVERVLVSDGRSTAVTTVGGSANLSGTRTTYPGDDVVKVSKITSEDGLTINGITYPQYLYATQPETEAVKAIVPEIGHRDTYTNLNKVTHDFNYVSTGPFVIYPYYYQTSAINTLGIYYYDASGQRQEVDVYKIKEGDELQYEDNTYTQTERIYTEEYSSYANIGWNSQVAPGEWTINNGEGYDHFHANGWSSEGATDGSQMLTPFFEYWLGEYKNLHDGTISRTFTGLEPGTYGVWIDVRAYNENTTTAYPSGISFFANEASSDFCTQGTQAIYNNTSALVYYKDLQVRCTVNTDGVLTLGFNLSGVTGDWLSFKNLRIEKLGDWNNAITTGKSNVRRGQGIIVDIPEGTPFGMYLRTANNNGSSTYYSESQLNNPTLCGYGVRDDGNGSVTLDTNLRPSYASTFHVGDQMFLGFEDWNNLYDNGTSGDGNPGSDFDLNDLVLAFSGSTPTIINEDPTPAATWILAGEDLGGTFDTDYNDIVLKIEHVSGQEFATVTPLAAGGTLASYIFFEDPNSIGSEHCLGEIHQLFGHAPQTSGDYSPINVGSSRGSAGQSITFPVSKTWTLAHYVADSFDKASQYSKSGKECNMGGFAIYVLPKGTEALTGTITASNEAFGPASVIAAPDLGNVPEMILLPYTYTQGDYTYVWAWPRELCTIAGNAGDGAYPDFAQWVGDYTQNKDWYKNPQRNTVSELKWLTSANTGNTGSTSNYGTQVLTTLGEGSTVPASAFASATTKVELTFLYKAGKRCFTTFYTQGLSKDTQDATYDGDTYVTITITETDWINGLKTYGITGMTDWNGGSLNQNFGGLWVRCE